MGPTSTRPITRELPGSLYQLARAWQSGASDSHRARLRVLESGAGLFSAGERGPAPGELGGSTASGAEPIG